MWSTAEPPWAFLELNGIAVHPKHTDFLCVYYKSILLELERKLDIYFNTVSKFLQTNLCPITTWIKFQCVCLMLFTLMGPLEMTWIRCDWCHSLLYPAIRDPQDSCPEWLEETSDHWAALYNRHVFLESPSAQCEGCCGGRVRVSENYWGTRLDSIFIPLALDPAALRFH